MAWFKKLFGKEEPQAEAPVAAGTAVEPRPPAINTAAAATPTDSDKKVKLNFKRLPKKVLDAIAAETTGQPRVVTPPATGGKGGLSGDFNKAATSMTGADMNDFNKPTSGPRPKMIAPKP